MFGVFVKLLVFICKWWEVVIVSLKVVVLMENWIVKGKFFLIGKVLLNLDVDEF